MGVVNKADEIFVNLEENYIICHNSINRDFTLRRYYVTAVQGFQRDKTRH